MRNGLHTPGLRSASRESLLWPSPRRWRRPTFGEFLDRVQREFGSAADLSCLLLLGLRPDERLAPSDIEALCGQLGVPPEDFGVGP